MHGSLLVTLLVLCACGVGCDGKAAQREEARKLLAAITALQDEGSLATRQRTLVALSKLQLTAAEHRQAREVCYGAHKDLLQAEVEQASAKLAMDQAVPPGSGAKLSKEASEGIAHAISRSNAALEEAQNRFPECQRALQGLVQEIR